MPSDDKKISASQSMRDKEAEQEKLQRALFLFDFIEKTKEKEKAAKRALLADRIAKQKIQLDQKQDQQVQDKLQRDLMEERKRKQFLFDRRKKLYAISTRHVRIPLPLEFLHPPSPHYNPKINPQDDHMEQGSRAPNQANELLLEKNGEFLMSETTLPAGSNSRGGVSQEDQVITVSQPHRILCHLFKSRAYYRTARDMACLRTALNQPSIPVSNRYKITRRGLSHLNLMSIQAKIDARQYVRFHREKQMSRRLSRRKSEFIINRERNMAVEAVFKTEDAYKAFKQKYEEPVVVRKKDSDEEEQVHGHIAERLKTKRLMYEAATRNRQRTLTFAQFGGISGSLVPAKPSPNSDLRETDVSSGLGPGLLHSEDEDDDEMGDGDAFAISTAHGITLQRARSVLERRESTLPSRSPSVLTAGHPQKQLARQQSVERFADVDSSTSSSRRPSVVREQAILLANDQMGKGRRGARASSGTKPSTQSDEAMKFLVEGSSQQRSTPPSARKVLALTKPGDMKREAMADHATEHKQLKAKVEDEESLKNDMLQDLHISPPIIQAEVATQWQFKKPYTASPLPSFETECANDTIHRPISEEGEAPVHDRIAHNLPRKRRIRRIWEPINLSAAGETSRTVVPTKLLHLPPLADSLTASKAVSAQLWSGTAAAVDQRTEQTHVARNKPPFRFFSCVSTP